MELIGLDIAFKISLIGTLIFSILTYLLYKLWNSPFIWKSTPVDEWCREKQRERIEDLKKHLKDRKLKRIYHKESVRYN